ncbi:MAG: hypothetical protein ACHQ4G_01130 [Opitutales bacterium]
MSSPFQPKSISIPKRRSRPVWPLLLFCTLLPACSHFDEHLDQQQRVVAARWRQLATQPERQTVVVTWPEAVRRLDATNVKLIKARETVRSNEQILQRVPRNYLPELSLSLFSYPTLQQLEVGNLSSTFFYVSSILNLPNPWTYEAQLMQAQLARAMALTEMEALHRDLLSQLYRVFLKSARLAARESQQQALNRLARESGDPQLAIQADQLADANREERTTIDSDFAELLGDYSARWRPGLAADLPKLDYGVHPPPLDGHDRFAALQILRTALQLVALQAQAEGLRIGEWPQVSVLISAPPIYQASSGQSSYLSFSDLRISPFISYSTDFRGNRAATRRDQERSAAITRHELDTAMQTLLGRLRDGTALLGQLQAKLDRQRAAERVLRAAHAAKEAAGLRLTMDKLESQIDDLNLSFWVLDDARWTPAPTLTPIPP